MVLEHEVGNHEKKEEASAVVDAKLKAQQVIDKIPTEKSDLFKFEINWKIVDEVCYRYYLESVSLLFFAYF
jgi:hypothetical protein